MESLEFWDRDHPCCYSPVRWWHKQTFTITDTAGWMCLFGPCYKGMPCYSRTTAAGFGKSLLSSQSTRGSCDWLVKSMARCKGKGGIEISAGTFAGTAPMSFPCLVTFDTGVLKMVCPIKVSSLRQLNMIILMQTPGITRWSVWACIFKGRSTFI